MSKNTKEYIKELKKRLIEPFSHQLDQGTPASLMYESMKHNPDLFLYTSKTNQEIQMTILGLASYINNHKRVALYTALNNTLEQYKDKFSVNFSPGLNSPLLKYVTSLTEEEAEAKLHHLNQQTNSHNNENNSIAGYKLTNALNMLNSIENEYKLAKNELIKTNETSPANKTNQNALIINRPPEEKLSSKLNVIPIKIRNNNNTPDKTYFLNTNIETLLHEG